jgi:hypothetical protein
LAGPRDILAKLEHNYAELETAVFAQDEARIGHALFDFAVSAYHMKDWLIKHRPRSYTSKQVEDYVTSSVALASCRDICNEGKHGRITQYNPTTADVTASVAVIAGVTESPTGTPVLRVKIIQKDGTRHDVLDLAMQAVNDWVAFFARHSV